MIKRVCQYKFIVLGIILGLSLFNNILPSLTSNANAASVYDSLSIAEDAVLSRSGCSDVDLTSSWFKVAVDYYNANNQQSYAASLSTFTDDNHYWGVVMQEGSAYGERLIFFSHKKSKTSGYYTFAKEYPGSASPYYSQILHIPVDWTNYDSDTFTTFSLALKSPNASTAPCSVYDPLQGGVDFSGGTEEDHTNFGMRINYLFPDAPDNGFGGTPHSILFINMPFVAPTGYEGEYIPGNGDGDSDGLSLAQELTQGTLDTDDDTDKDGLSDLTESVWFNDRDNIFCGPTECAYPNPAKKDLYVEIDWIKNSGLFGRTFKPSSAQLDLVKDAYEDEGIVFHADTGQFGGGEEIPAPSGDLFFAPTEDEVDFYDIKNGTDTEAAYFSSLRYKIWHYMITSKNYMDEINSTTQLPVAAGTGSSYAGDDDSIVSIEKIEDLNPYNPLNPANQDEAVAGTIIHELGHNLCLSDNASYIGHASQCIYAGIDNKDTQDDYYDLEDYESAMNYRYQFDKLGYSHGVNGTTYDHDDWAAVALGMNDFTTSNREWINTQNQRRGSSDTVDQLTRQEMIDAIEH